MTTRSPVLCCFPALLSGACAIVTYPGPRKSSSEVATIASKDTAILEIDGKVRRGSEFEILPGPHALRVRLNAVRGGRRYFSQDGLAVCFTARPGRAYLAIPAVSEDGQWKPEIVDSATTYRISVRYPMPGAIDCLSEAPRVVAPRSESESAALATREPAVSPAPITTAPQDPNTHASVVPATEPAPSPPAAGREPPAEGRVVRPLPGRTYAPTRPLQPQPRWAGIGRNLGLELGMFTGGDNLVELQFSNGEKRHVTAGAGWLIAIGGMGTPVWVDDTVGFGVSVSAGWKVDSVEASNGNVSFSRFPISGSVHALVPFSDSWAFLARGGLFTEVAPNISGDGFAAKFNVDLSSGVGESAELGFYYRETGHLGCTVTIRYSRLHYSAGGGKIDGSNLGLLGAIHYDF